MTNELVLYKQLDNLEKTLQDAEAKADRKREVLEALKSFEIMRPDWKPHLETIRKYIEDN